MVLPGRQRAGFAATLIGVALLLCIGGAWALSAGYGFVLQDAALGARSEVRHLNDLLFLQASTWILALLVAGLLATAMAVLHAAERRRARAAADILATLQAYAAGQWTRVPDVHEGEPEEDIAAAVAALGTAMRSRETPVSAHAAPMTKEVPPSRLTSVPVAAAVRRLSMELRAAAKAGKVTLRASTARGLPSVRADRAKLHQALAALLRRAVAVTPARGMVHLRAERDGDSVAFEVQDAGTAVPPEEHARVFSAASADGLAEARALAVAMGGRLGFSSVEGRGSAFRLVLPASKAPNAKSDAASIKRRRQPALPGRGRRRRA